MPKDQEGKKDGEKVTPTQPEKTEVPVEGGKWVFKNYDKAEATIDKANEHFVGTWVFEENKPDPATEYKVTHEFKSGTPGKELPDEVKALLPENQTGKVDGNTVVPTEPTQKEVTTAEGTWTFKGYDRTEATINGADEHFVGTWEFTAKEDPKPETGSVYVKYVAEDGTVLEEEKEVLVNAEVGTPYTTEQKTFDGYKFVKMDDNSAPANGEVKKGDQHVTYVYRPVEKEYKVDYEFKPSKGSPETLPEGVLKQLPEAKGNLKDGTAVPSPTNFTPVKDEENKGTWTFEAWDKDSVTIDGANEHVVGTWKFTKDEELQPTEYKVTHEFKSGTTGKELPDEVKALLPKDQEGKKDGEKVTPTQPEKTEVPVEGGKWVFKNYDKAEATIDKANEHFVGTWVFEENKPDPATEYKVTHEFKSGTPGKELPDEVKALLPESQTGKVDGNTVVPTEPTQKEVTTAEGTWTFKGYDKKAATIEGKDQEFVGVWEFIPNEDPQPELGSVYVKYVAEDGTVLEAESEVLVNAEVGTKYTTDKKTFDGYEFVKMDDNSAPANGEVKEGVQHVTYVYKKKQVTPPVEEKGNVYVKYVTEDGKVLEEKIVKKDAKVGEEYKTNQKKFDGYEFVKMLDGSAPANGKVVKGDQYVTYVYKAKGQPKPNTPNEDEKGNVYVKYVTEDGKVLEEKIVKKDAKVGEEYKTNQKKFDGYEFVKMLDGSAPANGKVVKGNQYVTYVYKAKGQPKPANNNRTNTNNTERDSKPKTLPKTGDGLNASTYAVILLATGAVLMAVGLKRRKEED